MASESECILSIPYFKDAGSSIVWRGDQVRLPDGTVGHVEEARRRMSWSGMRWDEVAEVNVDGKWCPAAEVTLAKRLKWH